MFYEMIIKCVYSISIYNSNSGLDTLVLFNMPDYNMGISYPHSQLLIKYIGSTHL